MATNRYFRASFAIAVLFPLWLPGAELPDSQPVDDKFSRTIESLAAPDPDDRIAAENALAEAGKDAMPALERAISDPRPEVQARARRALRRIQLFRLPGTSDGALKLADSYLKTPDAVARANLLAQLQSFSAEEVLLRLYSLEYAEPLRETIRDQLGATYRDHVARLVADDDAAALSPLLESAARKAGADKANHTAEADYAIYLCLTGGLDDQIDRWNAELKNTAPANRPAVASMLCYLYRICGKFDLAMPMARQSGDPALVFLVLQDQSAWDTAAREPDDRWSDPVIAAGLRAAFQRLGGHGREVSGTLSSFVGIPPDADSNLIPSKIFLLTDQPEHGMELMTAQHPADVCRMFWTRGDYPRAIEITEKFASHNTDGKELSTMQRELETVLGLSAAPTEPVAETASNRSPQPFAVAVADLKRRDFAKAADEFAAQWKSDPSQCDRLYLEGYAIDAGGDHERGQRMMHQAALIPLGDAQRRWQLAMQLEAAGLPNESDAQMSLAMRSGAEFDEIGFSQILNTRAVTASDRQQWQVAAEMFGRLCMINVSPKVLWRDPARYLTVPALYHLNCARQFRVQHDIPAAMAEFRAFQRYLPTDSEVAIEWTSALDGLGENARADEIFGSVFENLDPLCTKYPRSATLHNQLAWLSACCGRKLDAALAHAEAAVRLQPKSWQYLDTLAETHFRRGERQAAINLEKQAAAMTTDTPYCARQIKRFESAGIPSTTQPVPEPQ